MNNNQINRTENSQFLKISVITLLIFIFSFTFYCSKDEEKTQKKIPEKVRKKHSPKPVITRVDLEPANPTSVDFIRVVPVLEDPGMQHVNFKYFWFVNSKEIPGNDSRLLPKEYYKKNDRVYCRVSATRGVMESKIVNSDVIKIRNAPPVINLTPVGSFSVPGQFYYKIQAQDPDGDQLSYHLVEPIDQGINLNSETGEIEWDIQELPSQEKHVTLRPEDESRQKPEKAEKVNQHTLSSRVEIVFDVRDVDDGSTRGVIPLDLTKGEEIPQ